MTNTNPTPDNTSEMEINPPESIDYTDSSLYTIIPLVHPDGDTYEFMDTLHKSILKLIQTKATHYAIIFSKINNLNNTLKEFKTHKENKTFPETLKKQLKNIFKNSEESKALFMDIKLNETIKTKSLKAIEEIKIFNSRADITLKKLEFALNLLEYPNTTEYQKIFSSILDYFIAIKLIEFKDKQETDLLKKEAKKAKLDKKKEKEETPHIINSKEFKKLQDKITLLEKKIQNKRRDKTNPNPSNSKSTSKTKYNSNSNSKKPNVKRFQKGRKAKSQPTTPRQNTTRR